MISLFRPARGSERKDGRIVCRAAPNRRGVDMSKLSFYLSVLVLAWLSPGSRFSRRIKPICHRCIGAYFRTIGH